MNLPFSVHQEVTAYVGAHWSAKDGSHSSVHLNFHAPREFLGQLVTEYSDRFSGSVESCLGLLANPLFNRGGSERLKLSTYMGTVPLSYWLIRENNMPPQNVLVGLGKAFEQFARSWTAGPMLPVEQEHGQYTCTANVEYRRISKRLDARLELRLKVAAEATQKRFKEFCVAALSGLTFGQAEGGGYVRYAEPSSLSDSRFELHGYTYGSLTMPEVMQELRCLFDDAAIGLRLPD